MEQLHRGLFGLCKDREQRQLKAFLSQCLNTLYQLVGRIPYAWQPPRDSYELYFHYRRAARWLLA